jgi:two-component system NtrC family response regulator
VSVDEAKPALLIVEDDAAALRQLGWTFEDYAVSTAVDRVGALEAFRETRPPVVLLDLGLPPAADGAAEGLSTLREILVLAPEAKVIVVTGREEREYALQAVDLGACDFYRKPVEPAELRFVVDRALRLYRLEHENRQLRLAAKGDLLPGVIGNSPGLVNACRIAQRAAASGISVLLVGESGTGKELLARGIHSLSSRASRPFVAINCSAIPEQLLESELFGHERGAFTGAVDRSVGRFELAQGGTLFLDEVGDMPLALQAKLLRFLQERIIQRVGGRKDIDIDTRIVSATNQNLQELVGQGAFREDLYYRLDELSIEIPPLRERPEDAVALARHFLDRFRDEAERPLQGLAADAIPAIAQYRWPGNVRELENRLKRAVVLATGRRVTVDDLDLPTSEATDGPVATLAETLREAERRAVWAAWSRADGNVSRASRLLDVSRPTVYKLLRSHGHLKS